MTIKIKDYIGGHIFLKALLDLKKIWTVASISVITTLDNAYGRDGRGHGSKSKETLFYVSKI
jgi:hypothetical protein